jgi:hypothetical protein
MIETPDTGALEPSAAHWAARRELLVQELRGPAAARRRRRRAPRLALALVLLAGTAAGAVASSGVLRSDDVMVDFVVCLRTPTQDLDHGTMVRTQPDPVAACAELWERGPVGVGGAPPLVACAGRDVPVRVVPAESDAICGRLGLAPLGPEYGEFARRQAEAQAVVESVMTARGDCPATAAPLFQAMRDALAAAGLDGWRVVEATSAAAVQPDCFAMVDARTRTVTVEYATPENRIYSAVLGQEYGRGDETVPVVYEGRTGCPRSAPLLEAVRATLAAALPAGAPAEERRAREWRVVAQAAESCRAEVDGRTRTVTLSSG